MHKYLLFLAAMLFCSCSADNEAKAKCYTLQGTLAQAGHKGIIIQNGKKIIRKQ